MVCQREIHKDWISRVKYLPFLMSIGIGLSINNTKAVFEATVTRSDWHEEKALFVVSCAYAKRSLPPALYQALTSDTDWAAKTLI